MSHHLLAEAFAATGGRPAELSSPKRAALATAVMLLVLAPLVVMLVLLGSAGGSGAQIDSTGDCDARGYPATIDGCPL